MKRQYSFSGSAKNDSDLCTHTYPYRLASSVLPLKSGEDDTKEKRICSFMVIYAFNDYTMPDSSLRVT